MLLDPLAVLAHATYHVQLATDAPNPVAIIDSELAHLFAARELFMTAVNDPANDVSPALFLRTWSDSTTRVIALLRARRDLGGDATIDNLLDSVYEALEHELEHTPPPEALT